MNGQGQEPGNDAADSPAPATAAPSHKQNVVRPQDLPTVPDYELIRRIGHGAYGDVWLARSNATGALRAAKIVWRHTFEDARPFQREFAGIQRFERISREHPSQLALFHIGRNEPAGYFYYVMELADTAEPRVESSELIVESKASAAEGLSTFNHQLSTFRPHTLRADLEKGRLPAAKVLEIGLALSEALLHLHSNGLVHRDVKPSNVIFVNSRPKLADIGLVTDASDQCSIVGTEGYLPPEGPGTPQADIFALGKVLYEATTGMDRREFPDLSPDIRSWPDAAQVFELNEIILKACAQDSKSRYQTCDEMHADLALLNQGKSVRQKRTRQQYWIAGKRAGLVLSILATIAVLISIFPRQSTRPEPSSDGPDSTNLEANALCDKAMYIVRGDNYAELATAYTNFNMAIVLDTNFARPYIGLLELRLRESTPGLPSTTMEEMLAIARHLEALAPHLAPTYCAESIINWNDWHFPEAEHLALEAIKVNPKYELGHTWYGFMLTHWGWPEKGRKQLEIARTIAPSKVTIYRALGQTYYVERDYLSAIKWWRTAIEWEPHHSIAYQSIGLAFQAMGNYTNSLDYLENSEKIDGANEAETKQRYAALRLALDEGGIPGYWRQQWKWTENNTNTDFYWKAYIKIHLGNTNAALDLLYKSLETKEHNGTGFGSPLSYLFFDECWDGLRDNPRFKRLLDEIGFAKVMPPPKK